MINRSRIDEDKVQPWIRRVNHDVASGFSSPGFSVIRDDTSTPQGGEVWQTERSNRIFINYDAYDHNTGTGRLFQDYTPDGVSDYLPMNERPVSAYSTEELDALLLRMASNLNPATGSTDALTALVELREWLPIMKLKGDRFLDTYSNAYLGADFGWRQFFDDVTNIFLTTHAVDEFHRKYDRKNASGFTAKAELEPREAVAQLSSRVLQSYGIWLQAHDIKMFTTQKAVAFVRFSPGAVFKSVWGDVPVSPVDPSTLSSGLILDYSVAWNALPWSWLVDWLVPVGDYLQATSNSAGYHISEYWYALETTQAISFASLEKYSEIDVVNRHNSDGTLGANDALPHIFRRTYERVPRVPSIIPDVPVLNAHRVGTLSALSARTADWVVKPRRFRRRS